MQKEAPPENVGPVLGDGAKSAGPLPASQPRKAAAAAIAGLFLLGLGLGWLSRSTPVADDSPSAPETQVKPTLDLARPAAEEEEEHPHLDRADKLFKAGHFDPALSMYRRIETKAPGSAPVSLLFRLALCLEELGQRDKALAGYQEILGRGSPGEARLALLSQARVHLRQGQPREAKYLLWPLFLHKDPGGRDDLEAAYVLGLALALEARANIPGEFFQELTFPEELPWNPERFLAWYDKGGAVKFEASENKVLLAPDPTSKDQLVLEARFAPQAARKIVDTLATAGGLTPDWTPAAARTVEGRTVALHGENRVLLHLLEAAAESLDLVCRQEGSRIQFLSPAEVSAEFMDLWRLRVTRVVLSEALGRAPQHPLAAAAHLALGNAEAKWKSESALIWYERLHLQYSHTRENVLGTFNRGMLLHRAGRHADARLAFFLVADHSPGHPLADRALLHLGRMFLEEGEVLQAITLLQKVEARLKDPLMRGPLLATLAAAYTLDDDSPRVKTFLAKNRDHFQAGPALALAQLLKAYSRLRHANRHKEPEPDTSDLILALLTMEKKNPLGNLGRHIMGLAYGDLGMWDRAAAIYHGLHFEARGPLGREATFRLAEALTRLDRAAEGRKLFESLAGSGSHLTHWAQFHLARLDLQEGPAAGCVSRCRSLLEEPTGIDRTALLTLMGRAYEQLGNFEKAARCYMGEMPE